MENYALLLTIHVIAVAVIMAAILLRRRWLRLPAVISGVVSIWLPLFILFETLGMPNPFTPNATFRVISSKMHETKDRLYMFVDVPDTDYTPRVYTIPFSREKYDRAQSEGDYQMQIVNIEQDPNGEFEIVYVDYMPPDLLKGETMRGWTPREGDDR